MTKNGKNSNGIKPQDVANSLKVYTPEQVRDMVEKDFKAALYALDLILSTPEMVDLIAKELVRRRDEMIKAFGDNKDVKLKETLT